MQSRSSRLPLLPSIIIGSTALGSQRRVARGSVHQQQLLPVRHEMLVAPGEHRPQHRSEIAADSGQHIFVAGRTFAVADLLQQPGFDQAAQPRDRIFGAIPRLF